VVSELERMIAERYPQPGQRLPKEADLAEQFQVSRIVIREAMKILEDRGVVEVSAGRGTFTLTPSPRKVKDVLMRLFKDQPIPSLLEMERMLELRQILEETAAGLAAVRAAPQDLDSMSAALDAMRRGGSESEVIDADLRFHCAVAKATGNHYFEIVIEPLTHTFIQQMKLTNVSNVGLELHDHIFRAIQARNPVAARQAVRRLLKSTLDDIRGVFKVIEAKDSA
jgi:GntR family transcriptional regulator, transcriptional repressor for pyruvate dehydrogenase complex